MTVTFGQCHSYPARLAFFRYTPRILMLLFTPAAPNYMPVQDLAAATSWYVEKFGARPRPTKFDDGQRGAELWLADEVYFVLGPRNIPTCDETPMLYTPNIAKAREYLLARGVEATKIQRDRQNTKFFEMRDLEGNLIEICQQP
jgi:catechol 2,3-dioxygenase-like lactoylglutathione lyase family enzyme